MQDAELLESLALEKLNETVESIKDEGHAWVQVRTTFDYSDKAEFGRVRTSSREPTEEEQASKDALEAQMQALESDFEGGDEEADERGEREEIYAAFEKRQTEIQGKLDALDESLDEPLC